MTEARAAVGLDRLPWLNDEAQAQVAPPSPLPRMARQQRATTSGGAGIRPRELAGWAVAGVLIVAGGSYWLGTRSAPNAPATQIAAPPTAAPQATVHLPEPRATAVEPAPESENTSERPAAPQRAAGTSRTERTVHRVKPIAPRSAQLSPTNVDKPELAKAVAQQGKSGSSPGEGGSSAVAPPPVRLASRSELRLWPSRQVKGASGRLVQIGAFGSRQQAKLGWRKMTRSYPAVGRLPAVVVTTRNSRGRLFYRFQIGTTSQAHSEVLCQRMQRIRFSCAVIGLPWKPQGVER